MLSIIIPTLGTRIEPLKQLFESLSAQSNQNFEAIIAVQGNHLEVRELLGDYAFKFIICDLYKKGLSYARNEAIKLISKESILVTFSDDDCWYPHDAFDMVFEINQGANQCMCFQIFDPKINEPYKDYPENKIESLSLRACLRVSSIEIFIPKTVIDKGIKFDERFGLGTSNPSGEENIFLFDVIKNGYTITYLPKVVVYHLKPVWSNKEYIFKGKGALFTQLYNKPLALVMVILYAMMKRSHSSNVVVDLKNMLLEVFKYKRNSC
jgi:glycosyltransferase involved in cell wall biosynthesis